MPRPNRSEYMARTQQLIAYIKEEIRSGSRKEGDYLPSEVELGRIFSLSKESVRKALDVLVEEGLIVKIRRVGNKVRLSAPSSGSPETSSDGRKEDLVLRLACYPP
ncbi:GntR family transcriptional regulator [Paenibacillus sp. CC-CFT747]|nr:GntR family transcriptional regulator [Paenibacillus sp. CC-CFT747]